MKQHPKNPRSQKAATPDLDMEYVRSVLAGRVASSVADGDLDPPSGARCTTRSGFRAWLRRTEKKTPRPCDRVTDNRDTFRRKLARLHGTHGLNRSHITEPDTEPDTDARIIA
jgi:hypothetical protein